MMWLNYLQAGQGFKIGLQHIPYSRKICWCKISEKCLYTSEEIFTVSFSRKQDAAIGYTMECHASLPSLHVKEEEDNEKLTRLPTSLRQGISSLKQWPSYPCRLGSLSPSPQKKTTKMISSAILLLFVLTQGMLNVHRAAKLHVAQGGDPQRS